MLTRIKVVLAICDAGSGRIDITYIKMKNFQVFTLPVQSGSDNILKAMKRGYDVDNFTNIVKKFQKENTRVNP